jgi:hypothetical protein
MMSIRRHFVKTVHSMIFMVLYQLLTKCSVKWDVMLGFCEAENHEM